MTISPMAENHQPDRYNPVRRWLAGPLLLLVIVICAFWKITLAGSEYTWLESPDSAMQVLPWLQYEAREIHRGRVPLWDPHEIGGQSLIGQMQPAVASPLNWALLAMPPDRGGWLRTGFLDAWF